MSRAARAAVVLAAVLAVAAPAPAQAATIRSTEGTCHLKRQLDPIGSAVLTDYGWPGSSRAWMVGWRIRYGWHPGLIRGVDAVRIYLVDDTAGRSLGSAQIYPARVLREPVGTVPVDGLPGVRRGHSFTVYASWDVAGRHCSTVHHGRVPR